MNEVLMYGYIWDHSAAEFVKSFSELEGDSVTCRVNTDGGGPESGWSMLAKLAEFQGTKLIKVDGKAYSMGAFSLCYADDSECLDVSQFMFHRASYGLYYEQEYMDDAQRVNLVSVNKKLREAFEATVDVVKFENLKVCRDNGITVNRMFSMDERIDVFLTADEAKKIGLVKRIIQLTPQKARAINQSVAKLAASGANSESLMVQVKGTVAVDPEKKSSKVNYTNMTISEFKAQHPHVYAQAVQEGFEQGRMEGENQERERVGAWMAWSEIDAKRVSEGISSGKLPTAKDVSEFQVSALKSGVLNTLKHEAETTDPKNVPGASAGDPPVTKDNTTAQINSLMDEIRGHKLPEKQ